MMLMMTVIVCTFGREGGGGGGGGPFYTPFHPPLPDTNSHSVSVLCPLRRIPFLECVEPTLVPLPQRILAWLYGHDLFSAQLIAE